MAAPGMSFARSYTQLQASPRSMCSRCLRLRRTISTSKSEITGEDSATKSKLALRPTIPYQEVDELDNTSSFDAAPIPDPYDPLAASRGRKRQLPRGAYQYRPPKYDKGPFHPVQSPAPSDPVSREYIPGPFSTPRLESSYHNTIAPDIMTMCYQHTPPGFRPPSKGPRLRDWGDESPYHKNRQLRGPRGGDVLRLLRKPISFRNVPMVEKVTVHSYVKGAVHNGSQHIHVAGMVIQAITNKRVQTHKARSGEAGWGLIRGKQTVSVTAELKGEDMYHFLAKLINVVMPRIKDWNGVRATTGDSSGNLTLGLEPEVIGGFPEIEINYDSYPPKMIPGCHITIHTTADVDKDARLLLQTIGVPFYGKIVD